MVIVSLSIIIMDNQQLSSEKEKVQRLVYKRRIQVNSKRKASFLKDEDIVCAT